MHYLQREMDNRWWILVVYAYTHHTFYRAIPRYDHGVTKVSNAVMPCAFNWALCCVPMRGTQDQIQNADPRFIHSHLEVDRLIGSDRMFHKLSLSVELVADGCAASTSHTGTYINVKKRYLLNI